MAVEVRRYKFSLEQYEQMVEIGVLGDNDRVELIEGEIVDVVPSSPEHASQPRRLRRFSRLP